ncbi:MAG: efflux RND transporter periplasmic adaptor subunit [Aestuariivirga sp.]
MTLRTIPHRALAAALALALLGGSALAEEFKVKAADTPELKAVFGRVESRDIVPARARIGGTIVSLAVEEGSAVKAGDVVAVVVDDKLALQLGAVDARLKALGAELKDAETDLERGKKLLESGVVSKRQVDAYQTKVDVLTNQMAAAEADRAVLDQQRTEGEVIAPAPGRVLSVPVTKGSVVMAGETIARVAGGGYFLRLSLPERHAAHIKEGDDVTVGSRGMSNLGEKAPIGRGRVVKVYPEIEGGRVLADVEVEGLGDFFVGERTRVWIPVGSERMIAIPAAAVTTRAGVDYVRVALPTGPMDVPVIVGDSFEKDGKTYFKVLTGLADGDTVVLP